jgi:hypothetical protein
MRKEMKYTIWSLLSPWLIKNFIDYNKIVLFASKKVVCKVYENGVLKNEIRYKDLITSRLTTPKIKRDVFFKYNKCK